MSALAAPGQILVEGSSGLRKEPVWERRDDGWALLPSPGGGPKGLSHANVQVELEQLGYYLLKVSHCENSGQSAKPSLLELQHIGRYVLA